MTIRSSAPFSSPRTLLRIFAKAIVLLAILNLICLIANIDPVAALTRVNLWWLVGHGRARLVYPSDFQNGQLPIASLLSSHEIAYTRKTTDEYRVLVLGESGIAGWGLKDQDTLTAQLTARGISIQGKHLIAYNLAYPSPNVARDVLILQAALAYQPDLVIWFLTPAALNDSPDAISTNRVLFDLNRARLQHLTDSNQLQTWFDQRFDPEPIWQSWIALKNQDTLPVWLNTLFYPFSTPDLGQTTRHVGSELIPAKATYFVGQTGFDPMPNDTWKFLDIGHQLATQVGAQMLYVNEPMLIASGLNSEVNYNSEYERLLYENYRQTLIAYMQQHAFWFTDLWNVIPAASFTDTPLHSDATGYALLTDHLVQVLEEIIK